MVDLPRVPRRFVTTEAPRNRITPGDVARPYQAFADALDVGGEILARKADEWERAASTVALARMSEATRTDRVRLAQEANGDPEQFRTSWERYTRERVRTTPAEHRAAIEADLLGVGGDAYRSLMAQSHTQSLRQFAETIDTERERLGNELSSLAYAGQMTSNTFGSAMNRYRTLTAEMVDNPAIGKPREAADYELSRLQASLLEERVRGELERNFADNPVEADRRARAALMDPDLPLSAEERRAAIGRVTSFSRAQTAAAQEAISSYRQRTGPLIDTLADTSARVSPVDVSTAIEEGTRLGDFATVYKVREAHRLREVRFAAQAPASQAKLEEARGLLAGGGMGSLVDRIIQVESGGNPQAQAATSSARGLGQFITPTWNQFLAERHPDLLAQRLAGGPDLRDDATLSREATEWYAGRNAAALEAAGFAATPGNIYLAHFLGPAGATAMLRGGTARSAAAINPSAASANRSIFYQPDGTPRSAAEIVAWAAQKVGDVAPGIYDPEAVGIYRDGLRTDLTGLIADGRDVIDRGWGLDAEAATLLVDYARAVDDPAVTRQVVDLIDASAATEGVRQMSPMAVQAVLDRLSAPGLTGDQAVQARLGAALDRAESHRTALLADDPIRYGIEAGYVEPRDPLDFASPEARQAGLAAAEMDARIVARTEGTGPLSVLRPAEQQALTTWWQAAAPEDRAAMAGTFAAVLSPETLRATLGSIADEDALETLVAAAGIHADAPEVAAGIIRGQALLAQNKRLAPEQNNSWFDSVGELLPIASFAPLDDAERQRIVAAARYRYADLAFRDGDESGEMDERRLQTALAQVTGGFVRVNGIGVPAPTYGMPQAAFDALWNSLPDDVVAGAVGNDGSPITAADVRSQATLAWLEPGSYLVRLGGGFVIGADGMPVVLDLGAMIERGFAAAPSLPDRRPLRTTFGSVGEAMRANQERLLGGPWPSR